MRNVINKFSKYTRRLWYAGHQDLRS